MSLVKIACKGGIHEAGMFCVRMSIRSSSTQNDDSHFRFRGHLDTHRAIVHF